jgi:hypothetical protein
MHFYNDYGCFVKKLYQNIDYLKERSDFLKEEEALSFHFGAKR